MSGPSIYDMSDSEYALAAEDQRDQLFPAEPHNDNEEREHEPTT